MRNETGENQKFSLLRITAIVILFAGGIVSAWFTFDAGEDNHSVLLKSFFLVWILSPFIALIRVYSISGNWSAIRRGLLYNLMLFVAFVSMVAYSGEWNLPGMKPAFLFLVVPSFCWALMIVAYFIVNYRRPKNKAKAKA
jgi:hypothetical protein